MKRRTMGVILAAVVATGGVVFTARTDPTTDAAMHAAEAAAAAKRQAEVSGTPAPAIPVPQPMPAPLVEAVPAPVPVPATGPTSAPTTVPATAPTSAPTTGTTSATTAPIVSPTKPFPPEYNLLLSRSLFARGVPKPTNAAQPPGGPEANLGLRGVLMLDGVYTALIEDTQSKSAKQQKVGDSVGPGKIKSITLDAMEYESAGTTRQVSIGQNLLGMPLPPPPPPPAPPPQQPQGQPGQPGGPPGQPGMPGGPGGPQVRMRRG